MLLRVALFDSNIVNSADREYFLLKVLEFDHVLRVGAYEFFFAFLEFFGPLTRLNNVFVVDSVASQKHASGDASNVDHFFEHSESRLGRPVHYC